MNEKSHKVFICIPVHNRIALTTKCLESIYRQDYTNFQVILCDDGSTDNSAEIIKRNYPETIIIKGNGNLWWTGGINLCVKYALKKSTPQDYIFTLNNDTELLMSSLTLLVQCCRKMKNAIIGGVNVFIDNPNLIEPSAFIIKERFPLKRLHFKINKWGENTNNYHGIRAVDALSGKGMLIPIKIFNKIGLFNAEKLPHYHADTEFTLRAKSFGYSIYINYEAKILSHQDLSGIGTITSKPNVKNFIISFFSVKSTHHLRSLWFYSKILYKKHAFVYFIFLLAGIMFGFIKRFSKHLFKF